MIRTASRRAPQRGRAWSVLEQLTSWPLAALSLLVVGFVDRTPLIRLPSLAYATVFVLWLVRAMVFGRPGSRGRAAGAVLGIGTAVGVVAAVTGLWLDPLWSPTLTAAPADVSAIIDMSRFRSCAVGDRAGSAAGSAGQVETDRSMSHHIALGARYGDDVTVVVRAMAAATVTRVSTDTGELRLTMSGFSGFGSWDLRYHGVVPTVAMGARVRAGDEIAVLPPTGWRQARRADGSPAILPTYPIRFEISLVHRPLLPFGEHFDSITRYFDAGLAYALTDAGFRLDLAVISKTEREAQPCGGIYDAEPDADWLFGDQVRRAAEKAAAESADSQGGSTKPGTGDEFALRPTCTSAVVATQWTSGDGRRFTCLLDGSGIPTWRED